MFHWVFSDEERRDKRLLAAPLRVRVFETVCVVPAVKVRVSVDVIDFVKL